MPNSTYELTYVVNGVMNDDQIKGLVNRVTRFLEDNGAKIIEVDEWGTRRLSYQINKKRNGYYVNAYFDAEGELIARLERALTLEDDILRFLTLKMDAKMLQNYKEHKEGLRKKAEAEAARQSQDEGDDETDD